MNVAAILAQKGRDVITIAPHTTLAEATHVLAEHRIGAVVVADRDGDVAGVFSERDLARAISRDGAAVLDQPVSSVMTRALVTASSTTHIDALMELMTEKRVRHIIIMDDGRMSGFVSIGDVVKRKIESVQAEAGALKAYIETA
ncbi:signal transduction protein with CBS domains [Glycocaulis alkaliphilus]|uniref:Signal transduction protein with CBS domains n=1 Tax=Glycocaulis alkaliphilus TaxID=1434191 RepID=A0A3T0EBK0_9PROT|nr:CBS domain-containing protein [Glycocaulis alkaliphilus]AZU04704.1 signal transduction protein with CBS domains [Glycocaulis alkaliphilus]GGB68381.1 inosine-5-monophosphate dehydrogenase [Glycocaulis alkaliphilus]